MDEPQPPSPYAPNPNSPFGQPQGAPAASPYGQPQGAPPASPYGQPPGAAPGHNPYGQSPPGQAHNPYAAPVSDAGPSWGMGMEEHGILASRGSRFVGSLLDGLIYMVVALPIMFITMDFDSMGAEPDVFDIYAKIGIPILLVAIVQWYLIATTGQSLAKKMLGMKIIKTNGEPVNFISGVLLRNWVPAFIGWIPIVNMFFPLVNALFIFGDEHQCLHDKIASTKVISI